MHPTLSAAVADEHRRDLIRAAQQHAATTRPARTRGVSANLFGTLRGRLPVLNLKPAPTPQPCC